MCREFVADVPDDCHTPVIDADTFVIEDAEQPCNGSPLSL